MSYQKTTWADGDVITAAGLNNIEDGIETLDSGIVHIDSSQNLSSQQKQQAQANLDLEAATTAEVKAYLGIEE